MKNIAASVRDRLTNQSRASGVPFVALLERFVIGRLLWRVSQYDGGSQFVLKGAQLFSLWAKSSHRPTRDLDLLGSGDPSLESLRSYFAELVAKPADPADGLIWGEVLASQIREDQRYEGVRITIKVALAGAIVPAQVDIGFGDAITPAPVELTWQDLLGFPEAQLLTYPPETVIAEKLNAAEELGMDNSRMKDFYDLDWLCQNMEFDHALLGLAIRTTFERRGTALPETTPVALTQEFATDTMKVTQWKAFLRKNRLEAGALAEVVQRLHEFLNPVLFPPGDFAAKVWKPGQGWTR
jgi:hypothetical protein